MKSELYIGTCFEDLDGKIDFEYFKGTIKSKYDSIIFKGLMEIKGKMEFVLAYYKK